MRTWDYRKLRDTMTTSRISSRDSQKPECRRGFRTINSCGVRSVRHTEAASSLKILPFRNRGRYRTNYPDRGVKKAAIDHNRWSPSSTCAAIEPPYSVRGCGRMVWPVPQRL